MHGANARALARQAAADVHEARAVSRRAHLGLGAEHVRDLVREHGGRHVGVLHRERAAKAAALLRLAELDEVDAAHRAQQAQRGVAHTQNTQRVAGGVVGHAVRVVGADVLEAETLHQELR